MSRTAADITREVYSIIRHVEPGSCVELSADDRAAIAISRAAAARGEFVSDEEIKALWNRLYMKG